MIKLSNVNKYFYKGKENEIHVINDTSLDFPEKGLVVLLGSSGSGKTTLLNVLSGLDTIDSGTITFGEHIMKSKYSSKWDYIRNSSIGYIFQNYNLLGDRTVYRNIELVLKIAGITDEKEINRRIDYSLSCLRMEGYKYRLAKDLSGGQQQRVTIASTLSKNPRVIIADEPTGNLDSKNTVDIMNVIKIISASRLVILVTHDVNLANYYADRIIKLEDGKIIEDKKNTSNGSLNITHDQNIYLKDLYNSSFASDNLELDRYTDTEDFNNTKVNVKLIHRNETLYINVESKKHMKVKFINDDSEIRLLDAHQKTEDAANEEVRFDLKQLERTDIHKKKKSNIIFKDVMKIALFKIKNISRIGKLMYFSFAMIGALLALCIGILTQIYTIDDTKFIDFPREYLIVETSEPDYDSVSLLETHQSIDEVSLITKNNNLVFELPSYYQTSFQYPLLVFVSDFNILNEDDIDAGRLPENKYEIVIDRLVVIELINEYKHIGINSLEDILGNIVKINTSVEFLSFEIVGISNTDSPTVFGTEMLKYTQLPILPYSLVSDFNIVEGRIPEGTGELLVSDIKDPSIDRVLIGSKQFNIVGRYDSSSGVNSAYFSTDDYVKRYHYDELTSGNRRNSFLVYSNNKQETTEYLTSLGYGVKDSYKISYETYRDSKIESFSGLLMFCAIGIGVSALSIFFITRSDLLSRVHEVSVFRSLGSTKGDVIKVFAIEIIMITSISSFLGYMIMVLFLTSLQSELSIILTYVSLPAHVVLIGILIIYITNLFSGLIPVALLLQKTPSEIAKKYDL